MRVPLWAVKEYERKRFLERINRDGATIGVAIPETMTVQGERIPLRAVVMEDRFQEVRSVSSDRRTLISALRRERRERERRLQSETLDHETAADLTESILGIGRALEVLTADADGSIEAEATATRRADRERWLSFLRKALGNDGTDGRAGRTDRRT